MSSVYAIVCYTDERKENSCGVHSVYQDKDEALALAEKWTEEADYDRYIWIDFENQKVLFDRPRKEEGDRDEDGYAIALSADDPRERNPFFGTRVAVVEVSFIKRK